MILKIVVITLCVLFIGGVIAYSAYKRKNGKGCCGDCSKCSYCSTPTPNDDNKKQNKFITKFFQWFCSISSCR